MKTLFACSLLLMSVPAIADVVAAPKANITSVAGYEEFAGGAVFVFLDQNHPSCPDGAYINPSTPGAKSLIAIALSALMGSKQVLVQMFTDRIQAGRCEVQGIQVYPN
ncbi:MAG TPA: hypothetical protein VJS42_14555 [Steroidobacteraceae bacterium]|nr:hypothetical protein [Steroidobacteraceae bacterium]